jgi:hypothetical protein
VAKQTISDWLAGLPPRNLLPVKSVADYFGVLVDDILFHPMTIASQSPDNAEIEAADSRPATDTIQID